jgi:hypothetical protein
MKLLKCIFSGKISSCWACLIIFDLLFIFLLVGLYFISDIFALVQGEEFVFEPELHRGIVPVALFFVGLAWENFHAIKKIKESMG